MDPLPSSIYYNPDDDGESITMPRKAASVKSQSASILLSKPPMSPLPVNRNYSTGATSGGGKSASRATSRAAVDDALLSSPMPLYPRRRSVTFLEGEERAGAVEPDAGLREERPCYHTATVESAAKATRPDVVEVEPVIATAPQSNLEKTAPTPRKRSLSRQRMMEKRQLAVLHHSFYDDSFVEDFVSSARSQLQAERERKAKERAEEDRQLDEARRQQKKTQSEAAIRLADAAAALREPHRQQAAAAVAEAPKRGKRIVSRAASEASSDDEEAASQAIVSRAASIRSNAKLSKKDAKKAAKKAKKQEELNKLIQKVLAEQRRLRKSTRQSVVVVDVSSDEDDEHDAVSSEEEEEEPPQKKQRKEAPKPPAANVVAKSKAASVQPAAVSRPVPTERLESEDRPILLTRRPPPKKRSAARSVSMDPVTFASLQADPPKPKRAQRAAAKKPTEQETDSIILQPTPSRVKHSTARVAAAVARTMTATFVEPDFPVEQPPKVDRRRAAPPPAPPAPAPVAPPRAARAAAAPKTKAPPLDDPMAIFFEAAFPTPSKFEESMNKSAGMPIGSARGRHQALTLPPSIRRK